MSSAIESVPLDILEAFGLVGAHSRRFGSGLIHKTFLVIAPDGVEWIAQQTPPHFCEQDMVYLDRVSAHLRGAGQQCFTLKSTVEGALSAYSVDGHWRLLSRLDGSAYDQVQNVEMAYQAGLGLVSFHQAMDSFEASLPTHYKRVHDTSAHLNALQAKLNDPARRYHPLNKAAEALAEMILDASTQIGALPLCADIWGHGDPKISNWLFDTEDQFVACVDLDGVGPLNPLLEWGDAMRSWCNDCADEGSPPVLNTEYLKAALEGYASGAQHQSFVEVASLFQKYSAAASRQICVELAARYCLDVWNESYFGWDAQRFERSGAQQLVRGQNQFELSRQWSEV